MRAHHWPFRIHWRDSSREAEGCHRDDLGWSSDLARSAAPRARHLWRDSNWTHSEGSSRADRLNWKVDTPTASRWLSRRVRMSSIEFSTPASATNSMALGTACSTAL